MINSILKYISAFIFILFCFPALTSGQSFYKEKIPKNKIISVGIGPSFMYADNGGQYRAFNFKWNPATSIAYTKRLDSRFNIQATAGVQFIESGGNPSQRALESWEVQGKAFQFSGQAYYLDVMPTVQLFSFHNHMNRPWVNIYAGTGVGIIHVNRMEAFSRQPDATFRPNSTTSGYVPFRSGITFRLGDVSDLSLEGTILFTFSDDLDGNIGSNRFGDHLAQAQLVFRRYLAPRIKR